VSVVFKTFIRDLFGLVITLLHRLSASHFSLSFSLKLLCGCKSPFHCHQVVPFIFCECLLLSGLDSKSILLPLSHVIDVQSVEILLSHMSLFPLEFVESSHIEHTTFNDALFIEFVRRMDISLSFDARESTSMTNDKVSLLIQKY
jgi:hypothetical protein